MIGSYDFYKIINGDNGLASCQKKGLKKTFYAMNILSDGCTDTRKFGHKILF